MLFSSAMPVWISILVVVFLLALVKVSLSDEEARAVAQP